jgi:RNA polymerase sigma-70 factor (ECF subfamily)
MVWASNRAAMPDDSALDACSDDGLIARVAAGQADAFAALFKRRKDVVYRFALHMTGSAAAADDVTQDVFMAVMRDAGRYVTGRSGVTAWLCGIARNHARRRLEGERTLLPLHGNDAESIDEAFQAQPDGHPDPLEDLTRAEGIASLRQAILTLPLRYREAVVLCELQELSYAQAADALGCAVGTVRSRLHRGRALLASKLRQQAARLEPGVVRRTGARGIA